MAVTILPHTTRAPGTLLSASIYNEDHLKHVTNAQALDVGLDDVGIRIDNIDISAIEAIKEEARLWAVEAEDVEIEPGEFSSKHHALKSAGSATSAATSETNAATSQTDAATSAGSAQSSADSATSDALVAGAHSAKAEQWAEEAEDVEVEPGAFSAKHWAGKSAGLAAIDAVATQAQAEAGTLNDKAMTPLRSRQHGDLRYSLLGHNHVISDVTSLQTALDGKVPTNAILSNNWDTIATTGFYYNDSAAAVGLPGPYLGMSLFHHRVNSGAITQIASRNVTSPNQTWIRHNGAGTWSAWSEISLVGHIHSIANVTGLQTALDGKQPLNSILTNTTASFTTTLDTKLAGIQAGATANSSDAFLLGRANHTGIDDTLTYTRSALLAEATDLDTVLTSGFYTVLNPVNSPEGLASWFYIEVQRHFDADTYVLQTATRMAIVGPKWFRIRLNGVWQPWRKMLDANTVGVGGVAVLSNNWDTITTSGFYYNDSGSAVGIPSSYLFMSLIHHEILGSATQIAKRNVNDSQMWVRIRGGGTWSAWRQIYTQATILGTVSQSGGVPTGAVIERGSNANGRYVKFADGTMICTHLATGLGPTDIAYGSIYRSASYSWTFPVAFIDVPAFNGMLTSGAVYMWVARGDNATSVSTATYITHRAETNPGTTLEVSLRAIGRWF